MALKAHLFGWNIIQKGLTNTQSLSKFISMLLLIVRLLKLTMGSTQFLMNCRLQGRRGDSPNLLRHLGAFLGQTMPKSPNSHAVASPTLRGHRDLILIVLEEDSKKPVPTRLVRGH